MRSTPADTRRTWTVLGTVAAALGATVIVALWWWRAAPTMGTDEDALQAVDALFTAITARDEQLLARGEHQLVELRQAGKLPTQAANVLERIIGTARQGRWESAAKALYAFIRAQRPPPAPGHPPTAQASPSDAYPPL